ncbi:hypothetical protein [Kitasatospora sp. McL0602]|uniref:hypothetical protein n=1 Tax=Kitasatospora sp. McL0602 TaxID=3439530 RepID=UPI003F8B23B0
MTSADHSRPTPHQDAAPQPPAGIHVDLGTSPGTGSGIKHTITAEGGKAPTRQSS